MKRLLFAALILPLAGTLFFSCKSSDMAAKEDQEISEIQEEEPKAEEPVQGEEELVQGEEEPTNAAASLEEKIPQSEVDELARLLEEPSQEDEKSNVERRESGGLLEKILASNGESQSDSQADRNGFSQDAADNSNSAQDKQEESSLASLPPSAREGQSESAASNAASGSRADDGAALNRLTEQGNKISGGPLIGPSSDKKNLNGSDASPSSRSERSGASPSGTNFTATAPLSNDEKNEGISLPLSQDESEEEKPQEEKAPALPSRSMAIKNNQFLDIVYPGSGWIYLGEEDGGDHFIFQGRKLGNGETTFTLRSKKAGSALLHFYKNDILTGNYIDDYIQIDISDKNAADAVHVTAPSYAEAVPPKFDRAKNKAEKEKAIEEAAAKKQAEREEMSQADEKSQALPSPSAQEEKSREAESESSPSEKVQTVIQTSGLEKSESKQRTAIAGKSGDSDSAGGQGGQSAGGENSSGKKDGQASGSGQSLLERAQKAYDEKRYADALDLVQRFFETASEDFDAGLYLEGLILEAKSEVRNIKSAIGAYDTLIKNWPQSQYWRRANERSIYLKRFYIDIR